MVHQAASARSGLHSGVPGFLRPAPRDPWPQPIRLDLIRAGADQERARANRNRHGVALAFSMRLDWEQACWCVPERSASPACDRFALASLNHVWYCVALKWVDGSWDAQAIRRANRREVTVAARLFGVSAYLPSLDKDGAINRAARADHSLPPLTPEELGGLRIQEVAAEAC